MNDTNLIGREMRREEIPAVREIDRGELIENIYYHENGALVVKREVYNMTGWPPGEIEGTIQHLKTCWDRGGWFYGLFDDGTLAGIAVLDSLFIGPRKDLLQLVFLHISRPYRGQGWGRHLFHLAVDEARRRGGWGMYISATPSEHTIQFYLDLGCRVTEHPDPELFALEPEDIHLEWEV